MSNNTGSPGNTESSENAGTPRSSIPRRQFSFADLKSHVIAHKIDCTLLLVRMFVIALTIAYFIPLFWSSQSAYYKALIANAAISALRLHQRLGNVRFSREFLVELLMEDSCHYLFYSLIFIYVAPTTLVLVPIVLFAVLHWASYSSSLLDALGQNMWWGIHLIISLVEFQSLNILRLVAFTEIVLMPTTVLLVLTGRASLLTPFIYYHFLTQRYSSRRNPYSRNMFHELKLVIEKTAAKPSMPAFIRQILLSVVSFTCKLAPPRATA